MAEPTITRREVYQTMCVARSSVPAARAHVFYVILSTLRAPPIPRARWSGYMMSGVCPVCGRSASMVGLCVDCARASQMACVPPREARVDPLGWPRALAAVTCASSAITTPYVRECVARAQEAARVDAGGAASSWGALGDVYDMCMRRYG